MDETLINTSTLGSQTQPAITGFRGTQFVAVWEDREDGNIKGQMLSPGGNKTSGEFVVNFPGLPATRRRMPAIVETMSGFVVAWTDGETFFAAWADNGQGGGDTSGRAVRGRPLPIPAGGF